MNQLDLLEVQDLTDSQCAEIDGGLVAQIMFAIAVLNLAFDAYQGFSQGYADGMAAQQ